MKKKYKYLMFSLMTLCFMTFSGVSRAQDPPPPPPPGGHGGAANQEGGGAPIGSGVVLLIALAAGYGGKKVYDARKSKLPE